MAVTKVVRKTAEIDGKPIKWNVLAITGYLGGDFQTLEIKLDNNQAMLAGMLLDSTENVPEQTSRKANDDESVTVTKR